MLAYWLKYVTALYNNLESWARKACLSKGGAQAAYPCSEERQCKGMSTTCREGFLSSQLCEQLLGCCIEAELAQLV